MAVNFPLSCPLTIRAPCMNDRCDLTLVNVALMYIDVGGAFGCVLRFLFLLKKYICCLILDINEAKKETLRLDLIGTLDDEYKNAEIVVFNMGHWWTHDKTAEGKIIIKKAIIFIVNRGLYKLFIKP